MKNLLKNMNLPNKLTLLRILLVPIFCIYVSIDAPGAQFIAFVLFALASLTDMLDGKLARKNNMITDFGKMMDPIADKLLVTSAMVFLVAQGRMYAGACMVFIAREFIISGFRMIAASRGVVIAAGPLGKYKTIAQMIAVMSTILCIPIGDGMAVFTIPYIAFAAKAIMWIALVLAILSCVDYIVRNKSVIDMTNI